MPVFPSVFRGRLLLASVLTVLIGATPVSAQDASLPTGEPDYATGTTLNPKVPLEMAPDSWLDRVNAGFAGGIDGSARWVDGFFGEDKTAETGRGAYGRLSVRPVWREYLGTSIRVRLRVRLPLDNIKRRTYAILGRGDVDSLIAADSNDYDFMTGDRDNDWLAGLGYNPGWSKSQRVSFSAGIKVDWPPDPYARASYNWKHDFNDKSLVRFRETVFWQESEDFGSSTNLDLEYRLGIQQLLRWASWVKISGATEDFSYDSRVMLYQKVSDNRAVMYAFGLRGETGAPVPVREYGGYAIFRQRAFREWLFAELILGVTHYRDDAWTERKWSVLAGIGFEMVFQKSDPVPDPTEGLLAAFSRQLR